MSALFALLLGGAAATAMVVIDEAATVREEAPPHGEIGMSTAWRISDAVPAPRSFEFRKRALHVGAAIGVHAIDHDEIYYVLSGTGIVHSDGEERPLKAGTAARSEERRVGKACVSTCRSRWSPSTSNKQT